MGNYRVRIGTPVEFLLQHIGTRSDQLNRVIMGGPMMGFTLPNPSVPVIKTTNCILAPTKKELPPPPPALDVFACLN